LTTFTSSWNKRQPFTTDQVLYCICKN